MSEDCGSSADVAVGIRRQIKPAVDYLVMKARAAMFTSAKFEFTHWNHPPGMSIWGRHLGALAWLRKENFQMG
jgi:hypothetical protein